MKHSDWYFDEGYLRRWLLNPVGEVHHREAAAMLHLCSLSAPARVLDLGCGHGPYSVALAGLGVAVWGLDASWTLLQRALSQSHGLDHAPAWVQGDMQALPFQRAFHLVLVKDAFGYFREEGEDTEALLEILSVLEAGGHLIIRNPNGARIRSAFQPMMEEHRQDRRVLIEQTLDSPGHWLEQQLTITDDRGTGGYHRRQRLYSADELTELLLSAGFADIMHFSDFDATVFDQRASTHIVTRCRRGYA